MQNRQNGRRRRGSGSNNPRPMGQPMGGQNANRLEVRVRGNAHQLHEKYKVMARDAHQAGDRVAAEYYLQHADHYFRVLNDTRIRQEEMRARRSGFDRYEEDVDLADDGNDGGDGGGDGAADSGDGDGEAGDTATTDNQAQRPERSDRRERSERPRERTDERRESGERSGERRESGERDNRRRERRPRFDNQDDFEAPVSDGEAALAAFGGVPREPAISAESLPPVILDLGNDPVEATAPEASAADAAAKPVRRRGRPRKTEVAPTDS